MLFDDIRSLDFNLASATFLPTVLGTGHQQLQLLEPRFACCHRSDPLPPLAVVHQLVLVELAVPEHVKTLNLPAPLYVDCPAESVYSLAKLVKLTPLEYEPQRLLVESQETIYLSIQSSRLLYHHSREQAHRARIPTSSNTKALSETLMSDMWLIQ